MPRHQEHYDVVVIGSGNAGFSAASAAKDTNPDLKVVVLESTRVMGWWQLYIHSRRIPYGLPWPGRCVANRSQCHT